jgi:hypothetical protein
MAAGLSAALGQFCTVIEGCGSSYKRCTQRLSTLHATQVMVSGVDYRYWISTLERKERPVITGNLVTTENSIEVELARYFGQGDINSHEYYSLVKSMESESDLIEQSLLHKNSWAPSTTGIWLVSLDTSKYSESSFDKRIMFRALVFSVIIRQPKIGVAVP